VTSTTIDLALLDGADGFRLDGVGEGDFSGFALGNAGDVNGDGFADVIIGAYLGDSGADNSGDAYVVFGAASGFAAMLDLAALDGADGFRLDGVDAADFAGKSVSGAGDVNGDGFADIIVGASSADAGASASGESYVVFGKASGFGAAFDLGALDGADGFRLDGIGAYDESGRSVSGAGDVNGDGFADIIIGAIGGDPGGAVNAGESYVVFGQASGFDAAIDLASLDGANGFRLDGVTAGDRSGISASSAGDMNGDGFADVVVGAYLADASGAASGESYVVFGQASGFGAAIDLGALDGEDGFRLDGVDAEDYSGRSVSAAGDVNGDGFADVVIGAFGVAPGGDMFTGESYVVFGKANGFDATFDLSALDGTNGFRLMGVDAGDESGVSVSGAGDVNADGFADIIIGADGADEGANQNVGESFVIFGKASGFDAAIDLAALDDAVGFRILGANGNSGFAVSGAEDVNADGFADVIVAAPFTVGGAANSGQSHVVFGFDDDPGDDEAAQVGGAGDDVLAGDVLIGGAGDDTLAIVDDGFRRVDGGGGTDTLRLAGAGLTLDLTQAGDGGLSGIEAIDFADASASLTLDAVRLRALSDTSNSLDVTGGLGSLLMLADSGWVRTEVAGNRLSFANGSAEITADRTVGFGLNGGAGADALEGADGDDVLDGGAGDDALNGGLGDDTYVVDSLDDTLIDAGGDDTVIASIAFNLRGGFENLTLSDGSGDIAGTGNSGANVITGSDGANRIKAGGGDDTAFGNEGDDVISGQSGDDTLVGGDGKDFLSGDDGADMLTGGAENDQLRGENGDDVMSGGGAKDRIIGGVGADVINGDEANDKLFGNSGDDVITGGVGKDVMTGSFGADIFVLAPGAQVDVIKDFTPGEDLLDISAYDFANFAEVEALIRDKNDRAQINLDRSSDVVRLNGVLEADLSEGDFILI